MVSGWSVKLQTRELTTTNMFGLWTARTAVMSTDLMAAIFITENARSAKAVPSAYILE